jgi:diamine N-acetyltransferase
MRLRPARIEDISAIAAIERIPEYRTFVANWSEEEHRRSLSDPDVRYFVAVADAVDLAGFAILRGFASEHRSIELKRIVVRKPGNGIGGQMLRAILEYVFTGQKAHRLWLDVFETNIRAQHIYEKLGFRRDGVFREAIYRDGAWHSLLLMSLLDREYHADRQNHLPIADL